MTDTLVRNSADLAGRSSAGHWADGFVAEASKQVLLLCQAGRLLAGWLGTTPCELWHHLVCKNDQFLFSFTYVLGPVFSEETTSSRISLLTRLQTTRGKENRVCIRSTAATASFLRILNGPGEFCNKIIRVWRIAPKWSSRGMEAMVVALWSIYLFFWLSSEEKCVLQADVVLTMFLFLQNLIAVLFVLSSHLILRLLVFTVFEWTVWEGGENRRGNVWSGLPGSGPGDKRDCCVEEDTVGARRWRRSQHGHPRNFTPQGNATRKYCPVSYFPFAVFLLLSDHYVSLILEYTWLLFRDASILVFGQETESAVRPLSCCAFHSPDSAVLCLTLMQR